MIDSGLEPLVINDTTRVKAYYDEDSYNLDFIVGDELGVYFMAPMFNYRSHNQGDYTNELGHLQNRVSRDQEESAIGKYLALAGMNYKFVSLRGYSQGNWAEVVIYTTEDYDLKSSAEALDTWFKGDIFTVCLEKLEVYTSSSGATIERWEIEDSIGCITFGDDYTLETVANDYFTLAQVA
jgi:hypothetical protein